jgi:hypothetical protein
MPEIRVCAAQGCDQPVYGRRNKRFCSKACKQADYRAQSVTETVTPELVAVTEPVTETRPLSGFEVTLAMRRLTRRDPFDD